MLICKIKTTLLITLVAIPWSFAADGNITALFTDNQKALCNPGVGWAVEYYRKSTVEVPAEPPSDPFPGVYFYYVKLYWHELQSATGKINWLLINTAVQQARERGKKVILDLRYSPEKGTVADFSQFIQQLAPKLDDSTTIAYLNVPGHDVRSKELAELFRGSFSKIPVVTSSSEMGSRYLNLCDLDANEMTKIWNSEMLLTAVAQNRVDCIIISPPQPGTLVQCSNLAKAINPMLGYRVIITKVTLPNRIEFNQPFTMETLIANTGVSPVPFDGFLCLTFKDGEGNIISVFSDESFSIKDLKPGAGNLNTLTTVTSRFTLKKIVEGKRISGPTQMPTGDATAWISIGRRDCVPVYELPLPCGDSRKRYQLGTLVIASGKDIPVPGPEGYKKIADEGEIKTFTERVDVAFGAEGKFAFKNNITGDMPFNTSTFGDPAPGVVKFGFYRPAKTGE